MTLRMFDPRAAVSEWPGAIGFVPFIGERYGQRPDGLRVLLLGESHYLANKDELKQVPDGARGFTRHEFRPCETEISSRAWGIFFRRLDSIVSGKPCPTSDEAADGWKYVAYANYVQEFAAGGSSGKRPRSEQWDRAKLAFPTLLNCLRPHIVLAIGAGTFDRTPNKGESVGQIDISDSKQPRSIWKMDYEGGYMLMSWVYHLSRPIDTVDGCLQLFEKLIERGRQEFQK